ncbi:MAG: radical SAM protein [Hyphomicrobiaceae bacterium]|nr:radical SAM protein [Hyphomicrobiaceae bacterium]
MSRGLPQHLAAAVTNRGLKLIINSSEQCNLRCVYCYESFALGHMKTEVANAIVRFISRRAEDGLDWLELEFFGGEPLGAWSTVKHLSGEVHRICQRHGVRLIGGMTTNATLLNAERLDWLARHGICGFQITLDGSREVHDARRMSAQRTGSFDTIWQRLEMMRASDHDSLEVAIRVHFDARSWTGLMAEGGLLDAIIATFLRGDPRFKLHFNSLNNWGGGSGEGVEFFASRRQSQPALEALLAHVRKSGIGPDQATQLRDSAADDAGYVCYAARANAFVIRSDGGVSKCTVALDDARNLVGRLTADGQLIIDHEPHSKWVRGLVTGDASALACPAKGHVWPR